MKIFKSEKTALAAVKRQGINGIPHRVQSHCSAAGTGFVVKFTIDNAEDYHEIINRGFLAEISR